MSDQRNAVRKGAPSFLDRFKQLCLMTPEDLEPAVRLTLLVAFAFARENGGGIYASIDTLQAHTGLSRSALFRCLGVLRERGYLVDDGFQRHGAGRKTRSRRINVAALRRDRGVIDPPDVADVEAPWDGSQSPMDGTLGGSQSPMDGTLQSPIHGTQTYSFNQRQDSAPNGAGAQARADAPAKPVQAHLFEKPPSARDQLWAEGVPAIRRLTGQPVDRARRLLGRILRDLKDDCAAAYQLITDAVELQPADPVSWLMAGAADRMRRRSRHDVIAAEMGLDPFYELPP